MTKPDWCPEDLWASAEVAIASWLGPPHQYRMDCQEDIARAILAERERAYSQAIDDAVAIYANGAGWDWDYFEKAENAIRALKETP